MTITDNGFVVGKTAGVNALSSFLYVGFGTSSTTPNILDTTLGGEFLRKYRESISYDYDTSYHQLEIRVPLSEGNSDTFRELGVFDASSNGNMGFKQLFNGTFTKTSDDEIILRYRVNVGVTNGS